MPEQITLGRKNETQDDDSFLKKAVEAGFSIVDVEGETKKLKTRLNRLDRGGKEQFKGEREVLIGRLKKYGVEYVSKKGENLIDDTEKSAKNKEEEKRDEEKPQDSSTDLKKMGIDISESEPAVNNEKNEIDGEQKEGDKEAEKKQELEISKYLKEELKSLGITEEKLKSESYKKFNELSNGSKLLVLKNLKGVILENVSSYAVKEAREMVSPTNGLFSKLRANLKENNLTKKIKQRELKALSGEGIGEDNEKKLESLSEIMSSLEVDVSEKNGKTEIALMKIEEGMNDEQKKAIEDLNLLANKFLEIPKEMAYESATEADRKKYNQAKENYFNAKIETLKQLGNSGDVLSKINKADFQLKMVRDLSNDSVLSEEWKQAIKNPGFFKRVVLSMSSKEKMAYMASGYTVRSVFGALSLSASAIPLIMTIGGIRGNRTAKEKLRKQDKLDIYKSKIESPISLQKKNLKKQMDVLIPAEFRLEPDKWLENENTKPEDAQKYLNLRVEYLKLDEKLTKEKSERLNIASAESLKDKLDNLAEKIKEESLKDEPDANKLKDLAESLSLRMLFTREKIAKELVNYGSNEAKMLNHLDLQRSLDEADLILSSQIVSQYLFADQEGVGGEEKEDRISKKGKFKAGQELLNKILENYSKDLSSKRKKYIVKKTIYGALTAGAFASVGALIREVGDLDLFSDSEPISHNENVQAFVKGFDSMQETQSVNQTNFVENVSAENTFHYNNFSENLTSSPENFVETGEQVIEKTSLIGVNTESLSPEAIESLEKVGNLNKVVVLEKGNGVSKIFDGHMGNEYKVNFIDAKTGEMTEAAAFSKNVNPGDQVILGEDGKVYVVCNEGIKDNPLYHKVAIEKEVLNEENLRPTEKIEKLASYQIKEVNVGSDGKIHFESQLVSENHNKLEGLTNISSEKMSGVENSSSGLDGWEYPDMKDLGENDPVILSKDSDLIILENNSDLDKIASITKIEGGYKITLEDGSSLNYKLSEEGVGAAKANFYSVDNTVIENATVEGSLDKIEELSNKLGENNWIDILKTEFDVKMEGNDVFSIKDQLNDSVKIKFGSIRLDNISHVDPVYGNSGFGEIEEIDVFMKNGQKINFVPMEGDGGTFYVPEGTNNEVASLDDNLANESLNSGLPIESVAINEVPTGNIEESFRSADQIKNLFDKDLKDMNLKVIKDSSSGGWTINKGSQMALVKIYEDKLIIEKIGLGGGMEASMLSGGEIDLGSDQVEIEVKNKVFDAAVFRDKIKEFLK